MVMCNKSNKTIISSQLNDSYSSYIFGNNDEVALNRVLIQPDIVINRVGGLDCDGESFAAGEGDFSFGEEL